MKLDLYNKRLLAIIGSAVAVLAIMGIFGLGYILFTEISHDFRYDQDDDDQQLVVDSTAAATHKVRIVNTGYPELIDSAAGTYLIPLGQISVDEREIAEIGEMLHTYGSGGHSRSYRHPSETFNNLLLYSELTGNVEPLYSQKLLITEYDLTTLDNSRVLLSEVVINDTDGDGLLSAKDNKALDVYYLNTGEVERILEEGLIYRSYMKSASWKELHIMFYSDLNKNGTVDKGTDQIVIRRFVPGKGLLPIVPQAILKQVQKTIN